MSKIYQFTVLLIIIFLFTGCGGSKPIKDKAKISATGTDVQLIDSTNSAVLNNDDKVQYAEKLFNAALNKKNAEKNALLSNSLLICAQIMSTSQISTEHLDYSIQLAHKINSLLDPSQLTNEENNQYQLGAAAISLTNYQPANTLEILQQDLNFSQTGQWDLYHKLRAIAMAQSSQYANAVNELILRHGYLTAEQQVQENQDLIWKYLASPELRATNPDAIMVQTKAQQMYTGWIKLAAVMRDSQDPQTMNHAINFWLQSYPDHQANRDFINRILQARQGSRLKIQQIAVLLPLQGKLEKPAKAIQNGIMASHYQSPLSSSIQLRFYDSSESDHIKTLYQQAVDEGADFVIGPLAKNNVAALKESTVLTVPTLTLNSIEITENTAMELKTENLYQFSLSPESEARMVAEKGRQDGHYFAAIMTPENIWGQRMNTAFAEHWQKSGGVIVESVAYQSQSHDFSDSIKSMLNIDQSEARKKQVSSTIARKLEFTPRRRQDIDMLFMAAFPRQAKQLPLQVIYHHGDSIPIYSTAKIVDDYHNARENLDMDGVKFSDMPFLLGAAQNTISEQNTYQNTLYQRLFAMGVDSYQLAPYVNFLYDNSAETFNGDTGQININQYGHIVRTLPWATFNQGKVKLSDSLQNTSNFSNENASLY